MMDYIIIISGKRKKEVRSIIIVLPQYGAFIYMNRFTPLDRISRPSSISTYVFANCFSILRISVNPAIITNRYIRIISNGICYVDEALARQLDSFTMQEGSCVKKQRCYLGLSAIPNNLLFTGHDTTAFCIKTNIQIVYPGLRSWHFNAQTALLDSTQTPSQPCQIQVYRTSV